MVSMFSTSHINRAQVYFLREQKHKNVLLLAKDLSQSNKDLIQSNTELKLQL